MARRKSYPHLLTPGQAVEVLTARKTRPQPWRVTAVLDRLADQRGRELVEKRVAAFWAPLPARARVRRGPAVPWGKGDQLAMFEEVQ
ncbi:MAG: hypothetical protein R2761_24525 [Acidimicrobiales bacterium]